MMSTEKKVIFVRDAEVEAAITKKKIKRQGRRQ